ncbi:MAG: hypothetical protein K1060chlam5_00694 [Candidatus Anoxychlamydiales bacterium]|nr:hypothetical protein [Candidatus Anoxychlamydiales bacterium]
MKYFDKFESFKKAEDSWDKKAKELSRIKALKTQSNPKNTAILEKENIFLRLKSLFYILKTDKNKKLLKYFLKSPISYSFNLLSSYFLKKPYTYQNDIYFFNIKDEKELNKLLIQKNTILIVGFSYCHKPFECPSMRFSKDCKYDYSNDICAQCFIGKCINTISDPSAIFLNILDINHIGEKLFEIKNSNPNKKIIYILTACTLSIKMFADLSNMLKIKGISIPLDGRVCVNFKNFHLAEIGIKKNITSVREFHKKKILEFLAIRRNKKLI